jgi:nucleotide-binding universal stress UspA family protein
MTTKAAGNIRTDASAKALPISKNPAARKCVLCATDLSPRSIRAVTRAILLANEVNARLTLLHVTDGTHGSAVSTSARDQITQHLSSTGLPVRRDLQIQVREGNYMEMIAAVANETDADLIILGAQHRKPLDSLIGTTADRVIALADRPALIVNIDPRVRYGEVVIAAELSDAFSRVVRIASSLKFLTDTSVSIVHGFESAYRGPFQSAGFDVGATQRNLEAWEKAVRARLLLTLDAAGVEPSRSRIVFQQMRPIRAIQRIVRSVQPDLLIVGTKDRSIFNRVVRGGVANDALRTVECDVLVAPRQSEAAGVVH